ncbi:MULTISPECIES: Dam family site-specific DNA-(adenine-N6)-methyltransferase [unclassified Haloarcula]|uniref:DNA adenine methylase n=1 Tax=unclassified Haloarcula TaxID=2624677 RepID=UPI000EF1EEDC|nr:MULTISPECIES: Dam family site-specific DNA-(adenine-N6)-methyltransferase [unclassified Haloarcula]RLM37211.1 Dam family site-specific DNA-(adenine-N6)-methyltransferase [Haloarcula sp. Atlit-120R]RLM44399.1 Dam family site-specific DNA-(adenine-N6)-methyltransferase [Haloarcula sp. Atlit-47R]
MVNPVLKWAGGKRQLLDELYSRFPTEYQHYHEPFFGGGAVFFDLEPVDGTINDTNPRLVNFYEQVRDHPEDLIDLLRAFEDPESDPDSGKDHADEKNYYYQHRELFNRRPRDREHGELEEAALLLYLNRTCFNGLYRENSSGEFNVPIGRYADPDWVRSEQIRAASTVLNDTEIHNDDFEYVLNAAEERDLVYFDPPYQPMSPTANFAEYSADGFGKEDQERLLDTAKELDEMGVYVVLSNSGVMYDFYDGEGFDVAVEGATRSINSDADNRDEVDEIIVTNVPEEKRDSSGQMKLGNY